MYSSSIYLGPHRDYFKGQSISSWIHGPLGLAILLYFKVYSLIQGVLESLGRSGLPSEVGGLMRVLGFRGFGGCRVLGFWGFGVLGFRVQGLGV